MRREVSEVSARAGITHTFEDPDESAIYADLVRLAVRSTGVERVLDVGCGAGIATLEAARAGAREVVGIDVEPRSVELARANIRHAGQHARATVQCASWQDVYLGHFPTRPDLLVSNPPYVPGGTSRSVDGGFFGTSLLNSIMDHLPSRTRAVALLFGSISDPLTFLARVAARGFVVAHLCGYSVPFGPYTSSPSTCRHLRMLREQGRAFFCNVSGIRDGAPHAYLTLGIIAYRSHRSAAHAEIVQKRMRSYLEAYQQMSADNPLRLPGAAIERTHQEFTSVS